MDDTDQKVATTFGSMKNLVLKFDVSIHVSCIDRFDVLNRCISSPHKGFGFSMDER